MCITKGPPRYNEPAVRAGVFRCVQRDVKSKSCLPIALVQTFAQTEFENPFRPISLLSPSYLSLAQPLMADLDYSKLHPETIAVHAGRAVDPGTGAVAAPIHLSTTFERALDGGFPSGFDYSRSNNPNRAALEKALSLLEGGAAAAAFASGTAAASAIFQALSP